jgi:hypothetical protein
VFLPPDLPQPEVEEPPRPPEFPPGIEEDVNGLMMLGHLTDSFDFLGHSFAIRTLKSGEELAVSSVVKQYEGTLGEGKSYVLGTVAAAITTVDGQPLTRPLGPNAPEILQAIQQNFAYIGRTWVWPIVEFVYNRYSLLILRQNDAFEQMQGKSEANRPTF